MSRPSSPDVVLHADSATTVTQTATDADAAAAVESTMVGMMQGDIAMVPLFVQALFVFFEEGMHPAMSKREASVELGRRAAFVVGTLCAHVHTVAALPDVAAPSCTVATLNRTLDVAMGVCLMGRAWKMSVIYLVDTFVPYVTMVHLAAVVFAITLFTWSFELADAAVLAAVYAARQKRYTDTDACVLMGLGAALCYA